jgi:2-polyprenyl-3-methyl-5-hydroxy-6-metoxy-1,4-benzoquinol methylase
VNFDYSQIPAGYYDKIFRDKTGVRSYWHHHKFESVLRFIPPFCQGPDKSILDVGCFAGTFLGSVPEAMFGFQRGVDILKSQVAYAQEHYGTSWREFAVLGDKLAKDRKFHVVTLIEVVEHLDQCQLQHLMGEIQDILQPDGCLIVTTPNYFSLWPLLEIVLDKWSTVQYEEQHITKFNYFNLESRLQSVLGHQQLLCEARTTTHFLSPFVAAFSFDLAEKTAQAIQGSKWKNPLGCIILSRWKKS